jgi:hypothetical protein
MKTPIFKTLLAGLLWFLFMAVGVKILKITIDFYTTKKLVYHIFQGSDSSPLIAVKAYWLICIFFFEAA